MATTDTAIGDSIEAAAPDTHLQDVPHVVSSLPTFKIVASGPVPQRLLEAFTDYETALTSNQVDVLDRLFAPGAETLRGDGAGLQVGHEAIARFRAQRSVVPDRRIVELHVRPLGEKAAALVAVTQAPGSDARGLQTQVWTQLDGDWRIAAAHVSAPGASLRRPSDVSLPLDRSVWRVAGTPLVSRTRSGPLDGVTLAVKDLIAVAGHRVGGGNPVWLDERSVETTHAPVISTLLAHGSQVVGIAQTDEFAFGLSGENAHYGTPPNPAAAGSVPGGSTSGPASAVALRTAHVGIGTDTAGSIRVPASHQGLVGVRATHSAVSMQGVLPLAPSFDTIGWITATVAEATAIAQVLVPEAKKPLGQALVRVPTIESHAGPEAQRAFTEAIDQLVDCGEVGAQHLIELDPDTFEGWFEAFRTLQAFEAWAAHGDWITAHPDALGNAAAARFASGAAVTHRQADSARATLSTARSDIQQLLAIGTLLLPSATGPAPRRDRTAREDAEDRIATLHLNCAAGIAGAPSVSVPVLASASGSPIGLSVIGPPHSDLALLQLGAAIERGIG